MLTRRGVTEPFHVEFSRDMVYSWSSGASHLDEIASFDNGVVAGFGLTVSRDHQAVATAK